VMVDLGTPGGSTLDPLKPMGGMTNKKKCRLLGAVKSWENTRKNKGFPGSRGKGANPAYLLKRTRVRGYLKLLGGGWFNQLKKKKLEGKVLGKFLRQKTGKTKEEWADSPPNPPWT